MPRILFVTLALLVICDRLHAAPQVSNKSAEGKKLQARLDAQSRQMEMMIAYAARLRGILAHAGMPADESLEILTPQQRMQRILPRVRCNNVRLVDALGGLARAAKIQIVVDWKALADVGVTPSSPVNCERDATSVREALRLMLTSATSDAMIMPLKNGVVGITTEKKAPQHAVTRAFDVKAVLPRDRDLSDAQDILARLITDTIAPDSWLDAGGTLGSLRFIGDKMVVTQTPANLEGVENLLQDLDIDKENEYTRKLIDRMSHQIASLNADIDKLTARCRSIGIRVPPPLDQAMQGVLPDMEFVGAPLISCINSLRRASGQLIDVKWNVLRDAGIDGRMPITLTLRHETLAGALTALIDKANKKLSTLSTTPGEPSGNDTPLHYEIEEGTITVSTQAEFDKVVVTRTYDIRDLLRGRGTRQEAVDEVVHAIVTDIAPDSWRDSGGTIGSIRELQGILIVTQNERAHGVIKAWIDARRRYNKAIRAR